MEPRRRFTQQFFATSSTIPPGRVVLAGGLDPLGGQRSAFRASLACYDYVEDRVVWQFDKPKNHPFRAIARAGGVCAALLVHNFVRCPVGLFRFDLETGEPIEPAVEASSWKLQFVEATGETFLFSWVSDETSFMRAVTAREATWKERSFPYRSTAGEKTIERVIATAHDTFVAVFSQVVGRRVAYSVEQWSLTSTSPLWQRRTWLNRVVRNGGVLLFWACEGPNLDVELLSVESGEVKTSFRLTVADVVDVQPIAADTYAVLSLSGVYVIDAVSRAVSPVMRMGADDILDFGSLAIDPSLGKLIVVTAGNYKRPGTNLLVLDL